MAMVVCGGNGNCRLRAKDVKWLLQQREKKVEKQQWFWFDGGTEQEQHREHSPFSLDGWISHQHLSSSPQNTVDYIHLFFCCLHVFSSFSLTHTLFSLSFFCFFDIMWTNSDCSCVCFPFCKMCVSSFVSFLLLVFLFFVMYGDSGCGTDGCIKLALHTLAWLGLPLLWLSEFAIAFSSTSTFIDILSTWCGAWWWLWDETSYWWE